MLALADKNMSKDTTDLNNTVNKPNLKDIYRALHPKAAEYTFFSSKLETFNKTDYILINKQSI